MLATGTVTGTVAVTPLLVVPVRRKPEPRVTERATRINGCAATECRQRLLAAGPSHGPGGLSGLSAELEAAGPPGSGQLQVHTATERAACAWPPFQVRDIKTQRNLNSHGPDFGRVIYLTPT